jgi:hypothetical protein
MSDAIDFTGTPIDPIPPAPATPKFAAPPLPTGPSAAEIGVSLLFSPSELVQVLDGARSRGPEYYAKALQLAVEDGYTLPAGHAAALPNAAATGPDTRSEEAKAFDASSLAPAKSASEYKFNLGVHGSDMRAVAKEDATMRDILFKLELPASVGGSLAELATRSSLAFDQLDANGRAIWQAEQRSTLGKLYANVAEELAKVDAMVAKVDPEVVKRLCDHGFFNATVISLLVTNANRLAARRGMV